MTDVPPRTTVESTLNPKRWKAMPIIALAVSIIIMDATVVNVVLPVLIRDINLTASDAEWVNSVYALVFASLLITLGRIGDIFGRRRLLIFGILIFGVASLLAASSFSGTTLIAARLLQGVGGAMILPATLSTVNALFTGRERGIAFAIWGSTIGGMAAVGPVVGGWLTTDFSRRWAFLINIPIVLIVLIGALVWVPETKDPQVERSVDILGVVLSVVGLAGIVFAFIEGQRYGWGIATAPLTIGSLTWTWSVSPVPVSFILGLLLLTTFVAVEGAKARAGKPALLALSLLRIRSFRYGAIAALIVALGEFGMLFALPLFLQGALGYSALETGLLILALAVGTFLISGRCTSAHPTPGWSFSGAYWALPRSRRHHRARPEHQPHREWLGPGRLAVPLRGGRGDGHGAAHQRDSHRCPGVPERAGIGSAEYRSPVGCRPWHRCARHASRLDAGCLDSPQSQLGARAQ